MTNEPKENNKNNSMTTKTPKNPPTTEDPIGVDPHPRAPKPISPIFATANYKFTDGSNRVLNLPVRPEITDKQTLTQFRNTIKRIAIDLEAENTHWFIAYHRDDAWWQTGGNSLLFYCHHLSKHYDLPAVKVRPDDDFGCVWPGLHGRHTRGIMFYIKANGNISKALTEKAHAKVVLSSPELVIFELPHKYSPDQIAAFRKIRQNKQISINKLLLPKISHPHTYQSLVALLRHLIGQFRRLAYSDRELVSVRGAIVIRDLTKDFIAMSNGRIPPLEYYQNGLLKIDDFCDWLTVAKECRIFDLDFIGQAVDLVMAVKENFTNELTEIQAKAEE